MKKLSYYFLSALALFSPTFHVQGECKLFQFNPKGHRLLIGPEIYHVHRHREGGAKQNGWLGGGRFTYDHLRRHTFYWAIEGAIARGILHGKSIQSKQESIMRDRSIEGRFGYTFRFKQMCKLCLTPFAGIGYLIENNDFQHPSPLHLHFKTFYSYATAGFLSSISLGQLWNVGFTLKLRYLLDPKCKITHDPFYKKIHLKIANDDLQYRLELPVTYIDPERWCGQKVALVATPFYDNRIYGRQIGFPFDYLQTRLFDYGVTCQLLLTY